MHGPWGYVGNIFMGSYTHGEFSYHLEWSSAIYRFGDLRTYNNLHVETLEARSQAGKATLLAVHA